jgi:hypothetical protein
MADFETMSRAELVDLCTSRGLPTYGAKAALLDRLRVAEEVATPVRVLAPHVCVTSDGMRIDCLCSTGEDHDESHMDSPPADPAAVAEAPAETAAAPVRDTPKGGVFTARYDIDELDDDEHAELCARIVADAAAAGWRTRGGGRRLSGDHRAAVYGVSVR